MTFYLIVQDFHRTYATGAACQQRTLTPPDTWFCPSLGLACVLMSRPISPELVLSPDFWISNIPRYFCVASCTGNALYLHTINNPDYWKCLCQIYSLILKTHDREQLFCFFLFGSIDHKWSNGHKYLDLILDVCRNMLLVSFEYYVSNGMSHSIFWCSLENDKVIWCGQRRTHFDRQ